MTLARRFTKRSRLALTISIFASFALLAALLFPALAATNRNDRVDFADGKSTLTKNAFVKDDYVEFGTQSTTATTSPATTNPVTTSTNPTSLPTGKFYVVGKQIVDPDGNIFLPMGANVAVRQSPNLEKGFVFNYFGTANGQSEKVKAWGWNTIRVNAACDLTSNPSLAQTYAGLDELIKEYTSKKIVVLIDCHQGGVTVTDVDFINANVQKVVSFFDALAKNYNNNPYVWFNTANEPSATNNVAQWTALQNSLYARIRQYAPNNIFVADLPAGGNAIQDLTTGNVHQNLGSGKCNLVYGWHSYGYIDSYDTNVATNEAKHKATIDALVAKNIPVIIGEFGDPLKQDGTPLHLGDPSPGAVAGNPDINRIGANAVMKYAPAAGYGLLWWHATGDSNSFIVYSLTKTMTSPWDAINNQSILSPAGQTFWNITHQNRATVKFTGNLSESNCG